MNKGIVVSAHVGGKTIRCAAVDLEFNSVLPGTFFEGPVNKDGTQRHILSLWSKYLRNVLESVGVERVAGIGFSLPGPFEYDKGIARYPHPSKYSQLSGCDVSSELLKRLGLEGAFDIRFVNDAIGFAIGENAKRSNTHKSMTIVIDEGLGSSFLENGLPLINRRDIPSNGCIYDIPFNGGIADGHFSVQGILDRYSQQEKLFFNSFRSLLFRKDLQFVKGLFLEYGNDLGKFLGPILKDFNPELVVFGGAVGAHLDLFRNSLEEELKINGISSRLEAADENDYSFLLGAARLFDERYWKSIRPLLPQMI